MVGAVLVVDGRIIGEGWHKQVGLPHAEPMAIHSVKDTNLLRKATLYVNLEPCSHYGKTPPCVDLILEKHIPRVVIGTPDVFPLVSGRGIAKLRDHGVEVTVGVETERCMELNRPFFTFHQEKRPFITLKWAMTADGFIDRVRSAADDLVPLSISTPFTRLLTHKIRSEHAVILVGKNTALLDDPRLTLRDWTGKQPVRAVIDRQLELPTTLHLFDGSVPTLVYTEKSAVSTHAVTFVKLDDKTPLVSQLLSDLYERNLQTLLVEGGTTLHRSFLEAGLWDEIHTETSDQTIHTGISAPIMDNVELKLHTRVSYKEKGSNRMIQTFRSVKPNFS
jgi:diaminohydroxyphosphoribosylaminopyrimidine deaminase/5-amino-6-(5-phosphoribosylamino)uracil reductase